MGIFHSCCCCGASYQQDPVLDDDRMREGVTRGGMVYRRQNVVDDFVSPLSDSVLRICCCTNSIPIFHETHYLFVLGLVYRGYLDELDVNKYVNSILYKATDIERSLRRQTFCFNLLAGLQALLTIIIPFVVAVMNIFEVDNRVNQTVVQTSTGLVALLLATNAILRVWTESVVRAHHSIDREATDFANLSKDYAKYVHPKYKKDRWVRALHRFVVRFQKIVDEYNKNTLESRFSGKTNGSSGGLASAAPTAAASVLHATPRLTHMVPVQSGVSATLRREDDSGDPDGDAPAALMAAVAPPLLSGDLPVQYVAPIAADYEPHTDLRNRRHGSTRYLFPGDSDDEMHRGGRDSDNGDSDDDGDGDDRARQGKSALHRGWDGGGPRRSRTSSAAVRGERLDSMTRVHTTMSQPLPVSSKGPAVPSLRAVPAAGRRLAIQSPPPLVAVLSAGSDRRPMHRVPSTTRASELRPLPPTDARALQAIREVRSTSAGEISYVGNDGHTADDDSIEAEAAGADTTSQADFFGRRRSGGTLSADADLRRHI